MRNGLGRAGGKSSNARARGTSGRPRKRTAAATLEKADRSGIMSHPPRNSVPGSRRVSLLPARPGRPARPESFNEVFRLDLDLAALEEHLVDLGEKAAGSREDRGAPAGHRDRQGGREG